MKLDVLAIAPHPDDAELGIGGTILAMKSDGLKVGILDLTNGEPTPRGDPETRLKEAEEAGKILQVDERIILDLPNRYLEDNVTARKKVAEIIRKTKPDILLAPYPLDAHPDHIKTSEIVVAARFYAKFTKIDLEGEPYYPRKIFYYYASHLRYNFNASLVVDITDFFERKIEAIRCYRSQFGYDERDLFMIDAIESHNSYFGKLAGFRYGEPYFSYELTRIPTPSMLLVI